MGNSGKKEGKAGMLIGQYDSKVDTKGRTALPKKFREILGDEIIITLGYENSLIIVSKENWKALLEGTEGKPFIDSATRETQRFLLGGATSISLDGKGRLILPSYLREFSKIKDEVIFLGLSRYVEVWSKEIWIEYRKKLQQNIDTISQRLVDKERKGNE